jgi:hypothetical protein
MNARLVIEITKYSVAVGIGVTTAAIHMPAVRKFFKLDKKEEPELIPATDIEEEEPED